MIKLIQIIKYLNKRGMSKSDILLEIQEIVDNGQSEYFELTENDVNGIIQVFENDDKFNAAFSTALGTP